MRAAASSTTSSPTSTSSSTSDPRPSGRLAAAARLRLVHPFPSILNGLATFALALLAGGELPVAARLGAAMTALQFSIGALNDLADAPRDRGRRPIKPVAEGLIRTSTARLVVVVTAAGGLALAAASGPAAIAVAAAGVACGYAYDLRLSRTSWAWLPLAVALPLVPVFAWVGVAGTMPAALLVLVPIGMLAGGGLAVGNSLADVEADRAAGVPSVAVRLGRRDAAGLHGLALAAAAALTAVSLPPGAAPEAWALVIAGAATVGAGIATVGRAAGSDLARVGWQVEAVGIAVLGIGWVVALVGSGVGAP